MKNKKLLTILIIAIVLILAVLSYFFIFNKDKNNNQNTSKTEEIDTSNWKTYRNEELGFEFKYPEEWGMPQEKLLNSGSQIRFIKNDIMTQVINIKNCETTCENKKTINFSLVKGISCLPNSCCVDFSATVILKNKYSFFIPGFSFNEQIEKQCLDLWDNLEDRVENLNERVVIRLNEDEVFNNFNGNYFFLKNIIDSFKEI